MSNEKEGSQNIQAKLVDELLAEEGARPVGVGYYISNKAGLIVCVDPWGNVIEYAVNESGKVNDPDPSSPKSTKQTLSHTTSVKKK